MKFIKVSFQNHHYIQVLTNAGLFTEYQYLNPILDGQSIHFTDDYIHHKPLDSEEVILTIIAELVHKADAKLKGESKIYYLNPIVNEQKGGLRIDGITICTTDLSK